MEKLNRRRVYHANSRAKYPTGAFNCWGATLFVLGEIDRLRWVELTEMSSWIRERTKEVEQEEIMIGDVVVLTYDDSLYDLEHTATYIGNGKFFHKKGSNYGEITDLDGVYESYDFGYTMFRRML